MSKYVITTTPFTNFDNQYVLQDKAPSSWVKAHSIKDLEALAVTWDRAKEILGMFETGGIEVFAFPLSAFK